MPYKLCIVAHDQVDELHVIENGFQWGYKILDTGYNLIEHRFDGSAMTAESLN